jgi:hypothetical protein
VIRVTTNAIRNIMNSTFAIHAAVPAIPMKPKKPEIMATSKNINAQLSIQLSSYRNPSDRSEFQLLL